MILTYFQISAGLQCSWTSLCSFIWYLRYVHTFSMLLHHDELLLNCNSNLFSKSIVLEVCDCEVDVMWKVTTLYQCGIYFVTPTNNYLSSLIYTLQKNLPVLWTKLHIFKIKWVHGSICWKILLTFEEFFIEEFLNFQETCHLLIIVVNFLMTIITFEIYNFV